MLSVGLSLSYFLTVRLLKLLLPSALGRMGNVFFHLSMSVAKTIIFPFQLPFYFSHICFFKWFVVLLIYLYFIIIILTYIVFKCLR